MSIYRRKGSPHWWISISIAGRKTRRTTGTSDRGQATEFEAAERERLWRVHKLGDKGFVRFEEAAARWLSDLPDKSKAKEGSIVDWFLRQLPNEPLKAIDRDVIEQLRGLSLEEGKSRATVDRHMAVLRAVLRMCITWGYLDTAPAVPMFGSKSMEMRWLTQPQLAKLCSHLPAHLSLAARFAVYTGLRMRSMLQLTWDRIDLRNNRLWIPGAHMKGKVAHGLPLSRDVKKLLRQLKSISPDGPWVFQYNGKPIDDCNTRAFQKAVERSGVGPLRWHDLRHTFAAWAIQSGSTVPELMALGGWKSYSMALRYSHLAPDHLAEAAERVARFGHSTKKVKRRRST